MAKIPVFAMVKGSIASLYRNPLVALSIAGIWLIALTFIFMEYVPLKYVFQLYLFLSLENAPAEPVMISGVITEAQEIIANAMVGLQNKILGFIFLAFMLKFVISFGWMRFILTGENNSKAGLVPDGAVFKAFGAFILWLLVAFIGLLFVIMVVPMVIGVFGLGASTSISIMVVLILFYLVFMVGNILRLLPYIAMIMEGEQELSFKEVWRNTRGQSWRIFWGCVISIFPGLVANVVLVGLLSSAFSVTTSPSAEEIFGATYDDNVVVGEVDAGIDEALPVVDGVVDGVTDDDNVVMEESGEVAGREVLSEGERAALENQISMIQSVEFNGTYLFLMSLIAALATMANSFIIAGFLSFVYQFTCRKESLEV